MLWVLYACAQASAESHATSTWLKPRVHVTMEQRRKGEKELESRVKESRSPGLQCDLLPLKAQKGVPQAWLLAASSSILTGPPSRSVFTPAFLCACLPRGPKLHLLKDHALMTSL